MYIVVVPNFTFVNTLLHLKGLERIQLFTLILQKLQSSYGGYKMVRWYLGSCHAAVVVLGGDRNTSWRRESAMMRQFLFLLSRMVYLYCTMAWWYLH